ncbi:VWA domain-containing protein [Sporosarcina sp. GW1-11]|uniref:VWA domain-containing protein n=1 Tax=Sporosarcina sp. GW1-11 TaxID=2899126 RepID=UPI00294E8F8E|nr:VWA domain-containing protein [Sporosarcina sp. GW1-11]MDV6378293.1 VWA domain-containing protein [Sporosarcina sp. GW1-11]
MKRSKIIRDHRSVLNTDAFDKRRFKELFGMSDGLQKVREEGELPTTESLLGDIWAALYKMKPQLLKEVADRSLKPNRTIIKKLMTDQRFEEYRRYTRLDDLAATVCAVKFGEKINVWLAEVKAEDKELRERLEAVQSLQEEMPVRQAEEMEKAEDGLMQELEKASVQLNDKLELTLATNGERFLQAMDEAVEETIKVKESVISLMGGSSAGKGDAELKKVPLREQLAVADKVAQDPKIREIADWAGRFKQVAREKQKSKYVDAMEWRSVMLGNEIERLLPIELSLYSHDATKNDFLRRFAEGETLQYDKKKREELGKGPIVCCLDQSGSMKLLDNQSKGFILALLTIAKKQRRDLCVLLFSTTIQRNTYVKGKITGNELIRLARTYLGGGTDFTLSLEGAMKVIEQSTFKRSDVIFVTDGEDEVSEEFLKKFHKKKKLKEFNVLTLLVGNDTDVAESFSDRVLHVTDFDEEGSFTAFEI